MRNKRFRTRLKNMLIIGTIVPTIGFILIFFVRYYFINLESGESLFNEEISFFNTELKNHLNYYESLVANTNHLITTYQNNKVQENIDIEFYLSEIDDIDGLIGYYYLSGDDFITSFEVTDEIQEKMESLKHITSTEEIWTKKLYDEDDSYLYFGQVNDRNDLLVFVIDVQDIFENLKGFMNPNIDYEVQYKQQLIYSSSDLLKKLTYDNQRVLKYNKKSYLMQEVEHEDDDFSYVMVMDISREISFVNNNLIASGSFIVIYLIILGILLHHLSKSLIQPIDQLINYVSHFSEEEKQIEMVVDKENEFSEVYQVFDEMVQTSYQNIQSIHDQSEIIEEKNKIMEDLNHQLAISSDMIIESTEKLKIFEKQSKTLVDNIKDLMWVVDTKGRILYINSIVEDKLSYSPEELIGVKLENILKEDSINEDILHDMYYEDYDDTDLIFIKKNHESEEIFATSTKRIFSNGKLVKIQGVSRDITEERYIEKQMIQKNMISSTLNEISEILTRPEKLEVLLNHIVIRIERLLNPLICTIRLIDENNKLELVAGIGEFYSLVQEKFLDIDKDISGRAIKESKIIIITEKNKDYFHNYDEVYSIVDQSQELIFLPLEYNDTIIGVMSIGLREHISDAQLKILKVFTTQASAAIEKARMYEELENNYLNIIKALASTVEAKDAYTEDHSIRVSTYARLIAEELGMSDDEVAYIDIAGLLHDIGKIGVSDLTLTKEGRLTDEEYNEIMKHPLNGGRIVSEMKLHDHIVEGVLLHHKRFDLKGYPDIYVESLPISARIIGVADAFDAMTTNRSYQKARTFDEALIELKRNAGTQFCPEIVHVMERVIEKLS